MGAPTVLLAAGVNRTPVLERCSPASQPGATVALCDTAGDHQGVPSPIVSDAPQLCQVVPNRVVDRIEVVLTDVGPAPGSEARPQAPANWK